jgi:hypothetical protein
MLTRALPPRLIFVGLVVILATALAPAAPAVEPSSRPAIQRALDAYVDGRWLPKEQADKATVDVVQKLQEAGCTPEDVEQLLRSGRIDYKLPKVKGRLLMVPDIQCDHVDYKTSLFLYVPNSYDPAKAAPLLLLGHGGNSSMSAAYANKAALIGLIPWLPTVEKKGMILAAPLSERGWMSIGNSILLSTLSWAQRQFHVDPDRIYVTGHSMGGHLSWRSALWMGDRWGAVSPMSGSYDWVKDKQIYAMVNVPGYATFGTTEPYGINGFNKINRDWMAKHHCDWKVVEKDGGHEIFNDELPKIGNFLMAHPRNLYRASVYGVGGTSVVCNDPEHVHIPLWHKEHTWNPDRPIQLSTFHWLRLYPQPKGTPKDKSPQRVWAENLGDKRIKITSQFARRVRIYSHPKMVDFSKPVEVVANGQTVFNEKVTPDLKTMLELVREFDDRGRIFYAAIDVDIPTDTAKMPEPQGDAGQPAGHS